MSTCIEDLYDYDLVEKCSKCGIISLKINLYKKSRSKDGLNSICKNCVKDSHLKNNDKFILKTRIGKKIILEK